ncbi:MAG: molybdopterin cofactor-binding domain-containing protein [Halioglobus sp.]
MSLSRREFVRNLSVVGGGLTLGFSVANAGNADVEGDFEPNAFLRIAADGTVTVQIHKVEMGQGTVTGLITLIAEELEVAPDSVSYEMASVDKAFRDPEYYLQITGGSNAIRVNYLPLRQVGAAAKSMLLSAASQLSDIPVADLYCENGVVKSRDGQIALPYGQLATTASALSVPRKPALKDAAAFKYIGKQNSRLDNQPKVSGTASFGIDAPNPDALVAVIVRPPVAAGPLISFDGQKAKAMPGIHSVFAIEEGVAVVAENYWRARKAAEAVDIQWQPSDSKLIDSTSIDKALSAALNAGDFAKIRKDGRVPKGEPHQLIEADYSLPFLAHATMEPMNATVDPNSREVWVGSQSPDMAQKFAAIGLGIDADEITVHNQFLGGGFGRRAAPDHVLEAARIARSVGKRVKLVWSREDDTRHDFYRPPMKSRLSARLDEDGNVESWQHHLAGPSLLQSYAGSLSSGMVPGWVPDFLIDFGTGMVAKKDSSSVEGAKELPYQFAHIDVGFKNVETPVRLGYWRSVGHSHTAFVVESFVDELAHAAGIDPLAFRLQNLPGGSRHREVLMEVKKLSDWGNAPAGHFQGVAVHESFHSVVAEVVEISIANGQPKLERAYCAIHCGQVVNPDIVRQQMESGVLFGLSAAMKGEITLKEGAVQQGNFHDYPVLRMNEAPAVDVAIVNSDAPPTGVGEPATPPAPAALGNAIFAATGQRLRNLPFKLA